MSRITAVGFVVLACSLAFASSVFAQTAQSSADKMCPAPDSTHEYAGIGKPASRQKEIGVNSATGQMDTITIYNLSKTKCSQSCPNGVAGSVSGYCASAGVCGIEATTCSGQQPQQVTTQQIQNAVNGTGSGANSTQNPGTSGAANNDATGAALPSSDTGAGSTAGSAGNNGGVTPGRSLLDDLLSPTSLDNQNLLQNGIPVPTESQAFNTTPISSQPGLSGGTIDGLSSSQINALEGIPNSAQPTGQITPQTPLSSETGSTFVPSGNVAIAPGMPQYFTPDSSCDTQCILAKAGNLVNSQAPIAIVGSNPDTPVALLRGEDFGLNGTGGTTIALYNDTSYFSSMYPMQASQLQSGFPAQTSSGVSGQIFSMYASSPSTGLTLDQTIANTVNQQMSADLANTGVLQETGLSAEQIFGLASAHPEVTAVSDYSNTSVGLEEVTVTPQDQSPPPEEPVELDLPPPPEQSTPAEQQQIDWNAITTGYESAEAASTQLTPGEEQVAQTSPQNPAQENSGQENPQPPAAQPQQPQSSSPAPNSSSPPPQSGPPSQQQPSNQAAPQAQPQTQSASTVSPNLLQQLLCAIYGFLGSGCGAPAQAAPAQTPQVQVASNIPSEAQNSTAPAGASGSTQGGTQTENGGSQIGGGTSGGNSGNGASGSNTGNGVLGSQTGLPVPSNGQNSSGGTTGNAANGQQSNGQPKFTSPVTVIAGNPPGNNPSAGGTAGVPGLKSGGQAQGNSGSNPNTGQTKTAPNQRETVVAQTGANGSQGAPADTTDLNSSNPSQNSNNQTVNTTQNGQGGGTGGTGTGHGTGTGNGNGSQAGVQGSSNGQPNCNAACKIETALGKLLAIVNPVSSAKAAEPALQNLQQQLNKAYQVARNAGEAAEQQKGENGTGEAAKATMRTFIAKAKEVAQATGADANSGLGKAIKTTEAFANKMNKQFEGVEHTSTWPFYQNWKGTTEVLNGVKQTFTEYGAAYGGGIVKYFQEEGKQLATFAANLNKAGNTAIQAAQEVHSQPKPAPNLGAAKSTVIAGAGANPPSAAPPPQNPPPVNSPSPNQTPTPVPTPTPAPAAKGAPITGAASVYDCRLGGINGNCNTSATGWAVNPGEYSAALQVNFAKAFHTGYGQGAVGYARVENLDNGRQMILKINDNGPLTPGRIIDLSPASMNCLGYGNCSNDPTLHSTVLPHVKVTVLQGEYTPGPLASGATPTPIAPTPCNYRGCAVPTPNPQVAAARVSGLTSVPNCTNQTGMCATDPVTGASFTCQGDQANCQNAFQQQAVLSRGCANGTIPCDATLKNFQVQQTGTTQPAQPSAQPRLSVRSGVYGINPVIQTIATQASKYLPPGYSVQIISGTRQPGQSHVADSYHFSSKAVDFLIYGPNGQVYNPTGCAEANKGCAGTFAMYQGFMQNMKAIQNQMYPQLSGEGRWGGYFVSGDAEDEMHYDLGPSAPNPNSAGNWQNGLSPRYASYAPGQVGQGMSSSQPIVQSANGTATVPVGNIIDTDTGRVVASNVPLPPGSLNPDGTITLPVDSSGNPIPNANGTLNPVTLPVGTWSPDNTVYTLPDDRPQQPQPIYDPSVANPWPPNGSGNPYASPYASSAPVVRPTQTAYAQPPYQIQPPQPIQQPLPQPSVSPTPATSTPQAAVTLVANPTSVASGTVSRLSWSSVATVSCAVTAPGGIEIGTTTVGSALSPELSTTTIFTLSCQSIASSTISATTSITVH